MKKYQTLLNEVGNAAGIELTMEEGGVCAVKLDDLILNMNFIEDEDQCYFMSALFPIPGNERDQIRLYEELLEKNCFFRGTLGGILGIDRGLNQVTYGVKFVVGGMSGSDFIHRVETFINAAEAFVETLGTPCPGTDNAKDNNIPAQAYQNMIKI